MKISIITPVYNAADWVAACIESVASQTHDSIEHLVLDGRSTDGTLQILQEKASKYPHLRYTTEKDDGIYDAMNKGLRLATGDYLLFLGADDVLASPSVLSKVAAAAAVSRPAIVYGSVRLRGDGFKPLKDGDLYGGPFDLTRLLKQNICHQAIFYSREIVDRVGPYHRDFKYLADWDYNVRCWSKAPFLFIDEVIAIYNTTGASARSVDLNFLFGFYEKAAEHLGLSLFSREYRSTRRILGFVGRQKLKQHHNPRGVYYLAASVWHRLFSHERDAA